MMSFYRDCPMKGYLRVKRGLVKRHERLGPALYWGQGIHKAMGVLLATGGDQRAAIECFMSFYTDNPWETDKGLTTQLAAERILNYTECYAAWISQHEVLALEHYFEFPLYEDKSLPWWCGRIDLIARNKQTGQVLGDDWKSTGQMTSSKIETMRMKTQFRMYQNYLKHHSQWKDYVGDVFLCDHILTVAKSQYATDPRWPLRRERIQGTPSMLARAVRDQRKWIEAIDFFQADGKEPPMNDDQCNKYNAVCPYYSLCSQPEELRETQIAMLYDEKHWDPAGVED